MHSKGCFHNLVKFLLFIFNMIFVLLSIAVAIGGIVLYIKFKDLLVTADVNTEYMEQVLKATSIALITFGIITLFIAFSGSWGSIIESKCLLIAFSIFMFVFAAAKILVIILYITKVDSIKGEVNDSLNKAFRSDIKSNDNIAFHVVEVWLHCCGTVGPHSYFPLPKTPPTCCANNITSIESLIQSTNKFAKMLQSTHDRKVSAEDMCSLDKSNVGGCLKAADDYVDYYSGIIKKTFISITAVEILEFLAAVYLCYSISQNRKEKHYY